MEAFVYQALIMNVVWHWEITALVLAFPMDISFQLKGEIEHPDMKGLTDIDYMHNIMPTLNQSNTPLSNWHPNAQVVIIKTVLHTIPMGKIC